MKVKSFQYQLCSLFKSAHTWLALNPLLCRCLPMGRVVASNYVEANCWRAPRCAPPRIEGRENLLSSKRNGSVCVSTHNKLTSECNSKKILHFFIQVILIWVHLSLKMSVLLIRVILWIWGTIINTAEDNFLCLQLELTLDHAWRFILFISCLVWLIGISIKLQIQVCTVRWAGLFCAMNLCKLKFRYKQQQLQMTFQNEILLKEKSVRFLSMSVWCLY